MTLWMKCLKNKCPPGAGGMRNTMRGWAKKQWYCFKRRQKPPRAATRNSFLIEARCKRDEKYNAWVAELVYALA